MRSRSILLLVVLALGCGNNGNTVSNPGTAHQVSAVGTASWSPGTITVKAGEEVTFRNSSGSVPHNVKFDQGVAGHPPDVSDFTSSSRAVTFTTPGTYAYHCGLHPNMTGQVVVTQ